MVVTGNQSNGSTLGMQRCRNSSWKMQRLMVASTFLVNSKAVHFLKILWASTYDDRDCDEAQQDTVVPVAGIDSALCQTFVSPVLFYEWCTKTLDVFGLPILVSPDIRYFVHGVSAKSCRSLV